MGKIEETIDTMLIPYVTRDNERREIVTAILAEFRKIIPEEKKVKYENEQKTLINIFSHQEYGYNQCRADLLARMEGK